MTEPAPLTTLSLDEGFEPVAERFLAHMTEGPELGAAFCVQIDGETVVDLFAGVADPRGEAPFRADTLAPVHSCTKLVTALVVARLVDQGALDYGLRVADVWPEFAQAGKDKVTLEAILSHQAGLPGLAGDWSPADWYDWDKTCSRLAQAAPMWPLGEGTGYHPITWGYLVGETVARATGRPLETILREDITGPLGLDFWMAVPESEHARCASLRKPSHIPNFGEINPATRAAFLEPWSYPAGRPRAEQRAFALPAASGFTTARALASLAQPFAREGRLGETRLLSPAGIAEAMRPRADGPDRVLPFDVTFAAGFYRNKHGGFGPGRASVGHAGFGGSCVIADPERGLTAAYTMVRQAPSLMPDARSLGLIASAYGCL